MKKENKKQAEKKDINARDFGWKFNGEFSVRLFHTLIRRPISELSLKEIKKEDFLKEQNVGIVTWNEFVKVKNDYFGIVNDNQKDIEMKTAMQQLIVYIESNEIVYNKHLILKIKELLEKEKEQIIDFGYKCRDSKNTLPQDIFNLTYINKINNL